MKQSKIFYDKDADAVYIFLRKGREVEFEEIEPNVIIEYDKQGKPLGIEILKAQSLLNC